MLPRQLRSLVTEVIKSVRWRYQSTVGLNLDLIGLPLSSVHCLEGKGRRADHGKGLVTALKKCSKVTFGSSRHSQCISVIAPTYWTGCISRCSTTIDIASALVHAEKYQSYCD